MKTFYANDLTIEQAHELFYIAITSMNMLIHDLVSPIAAVNNGVVLLSEAIDEGLKTGWAGDTVNTIAAAHDLIRASCIRSSTRLMEANRLLPQMYRGSNQFIASPKYILSRSVECLRGSEIELKESPSNEDLHLIYPHCALHTLFNEIIANCRDHARSRLRPSTILVDWRLAGDRFVCAISDNGPGIVNDLDESYRNISEVYEALRKESRDPRIQSESDRAISTATPRPQDKNMGLDLLARIVHRSNGFLRFRRSDLGGTEVEFAFPVIGTWHPSALPPINKSREP